jgi:Holliday junction resolvase RusA-like endonuclease
MIEFTVEGLPIALKRHRNTRNGGKMWVYDPSKFDKANFLKKSLKTAPKSPALGPISMTVEFYFGRPKKHYRSGQHSHLLKNNCPDWHIIKADIDNLLKLVMDSLTGVYYKDDCQICYVKMLKKYSTNPRTVVQLKGVE